MVLGSGGHVSPDTPMPATDGGSVDSTLQQDPTRESGELEPPRMVTRAYVIKAQGFSAEVVARIEAP